MEAVFLILIGAALFSYSWHILGLYPDGRSMGVYVGALGLGSLIAIWFAPMVLVGGDADASPLAETMIMKMLIIAWAGYAVGLAAQGLFDLDERAVGFYSGVVSVVSTVAFFYYASTLSAAYGEDVTIWLSTATLLLSIMAGMLFFYLAIPFTVLRLVSGWFMLVGGSVVTGIGLAIVTNVIQGT